MSRKESSMPKLVTVEEPTAEHRQTILDGLASFNLSLAGPGSRLTLCIGIEGEDGTLTGGLYGWTIYDWLFVELLFVPEQLRGHGLGADLLVRAEAEARARGCIGAWLDTFSFQARGFYEKLGYELAGTIPDHPRGGARYILAKRWSS
jgi:GNAT superfamily N-acetyltransferase